MTKKLLRISTAVAVVNYFRGLILKGHMKPGDTIPSERSLMEELGISRFSLREGLARLNALGIIDVRHGKASCVCDSVSASALTDVFLPLFSSPNPGPKLRMFFDLIHARIILEKAMFSKAAELRTGKDLKVLQQILDKAAENFDDTDQFAELDYQFHQEVGRIANNRILSAMQEMLHINVQNFIRTNVRNRSSRKRSFEDHKKLFECIKNRQTVRVESMIEEHIETCREHYIRISSGKSVRTRS